MQKQYYNFFKLFITAVMVFSCATTDYKPTIFIKEVEWVLKVVSLFPSGGMILYDENSSEPQDYYTISFSNDFLVEKTYFQSEVYFTKLTPILEINDRYFKVSNINTNGLYTIMTYWYDVDKANYILRITNIRIEMPFITIENMWNGVPVMELLYIMYR